MKVMNFNPDPLSYNLDFVTSTSIKVSWEARSELVAYYLDSDGGPSYQYYKGPDNTVTISNLKPNTEYKFILAGQKDPNNRTYPARFTVRTPARVVSPPTFFTYYNNTESEVSFFWNPGQVEFGEPRYEIHRDGNLLEVSYRPPFTDFRPQQGRDHVYCIRTLDEEFNRSEPVCVTVSFRDVTAPTAPSNLRTSNLGLTLSWDESFDSSEDVEYLVDEGGGDPGRTKETEFAFTDLELGKRYEFGVTAIDKAGNRSERVIIHYPALGVPVKGKP
jgi:hypothetical protein